MWNTFYSIVFLSMIFLIPYFSIIFSILKKIDPRQKFSQMIISSTCKRVTNSWIHYSKACARIIIFSGKITSSLAKMIPDFPNDTAQMLFVVALHDLYDISFEKSRTKNTLLSNSNIVMIKPEVAVFSQLWMWWRSN